MDAQNLETSADFFSYNLFEKISFICDFNFAWSWNRIHFLLQSSPGITRTAEQISRGDHCCGERYAVLQADGKTSTGGCTLASRLSFWTIIPQADGPGLDVLIQAAICSTVADVCNVTDKIRVQARLYVWFRLSDTSEYMQRNLLQSSWVLFTFFDPNFFSRILYRFKFDRLVLWDSRIRCTLIRHLG